MQAQAAASRSARPAAAPRSEAASATAATESQAATDVATEVERLERWIEEMEAELRDARTASTAAGAAPAPSANANVSSSSWRNTPPRRSVARAVPKAESEWTGRSSTTAPPQVGGEPPVADPATRFLASSRLDIDSGKLDPLAYQVCELV